MIIANLVTSSQRVFLFTLLLFSSLSAYARIDPQHFSEFEVQQHLNSLPPSLSYQQTNPENIAFNTHTKQQRYRFLRHSLISQEKDARVWHYGWTGVYSTAIVFNYTNRNDPENQDEFNRSNIGISTSAIALGTQLFYDRYPALNVKRKLFDSDLNLQTKIEQAEHILKQRSDFVIELNSFRSKLPSYFLGLVAAGLIAENGDTNDTLLSLATCFAGVEAARRSLPRQAKYDWQAYQAGHYSIYDFEEPAHKPFKFSFTPTANGAKFDWQF